MAEQEQWQEVGSGGSYIKFNNIGDSVTGKLTGSGVKSGKFGDKTEFYFVTADKDAVPFTVSASADLKQKLQAVQTGKIVRMTFDSKKDINKGNPLKVFKVEVR